MPKIELKTDIQAAIEICFDLARSIDLHKLSTAKTKEHAIAGKTSGLIGLNEFVTWQATHFDIRQTLTTKITAFERPRYFVDEQVAGVFKSIYHKHSFTQVGKIVIMKDYFDFESPLGVLGHLFNEIILTQYLKRFLVERNNIIKAFAESDQWKTILEA